MTVYVVNVSVKPGHEEEFMAATVKNHIMTRKEPGNIRFDCLRSSASSSSFVLYEVYESPEAAASHKLTKHYLEWKSAVETWMTAPRQGTLYEIVCPRDGRDWGIK